MAKAFFILVLIWTCSVHAQTVSEQQSETKTHIKRIDETIGWIYSSTDTRRPTGRTGWFNGAKALFYMNTNSMLNGADVSFGHFLYRTYDMYCALKNKNANCLGNKLNVSFSIQGASRDGGKVLYAKTNVGTISANYFQEIRAQFFSHLESLGGAVAQSGAVVAILQSGRQLKMPVNMEVTLDNNGGGNNAWKESDYVLAVLAQARVVIGNVVGFDITKKDYYRNSGLYQDKNQLSTLNRASGFRSRNKIQVHISGPGTTSSSGLSWVGKNTEPVFAMRARYNDWSNPSSYKSAAAYDNTAKIFLHELGHNMGLDHCGSSQGTKLCTDNFFRLDQGRSELVKYLNQVGGMRVAYEY